MVKDGLDGEHTVKILEKTGQMVSAISKYFSPIESQE